MFPEQKVAVHMNDVVFVVRVMLSERVQYLDLNGTLFVEPLFVTDDFQGFVDFPFVVEHLYDLPKRAFP
jgi:hypothetical protein